MERLTTNAGIIKERSTRGRTRAVIFACASVLGILLVALLILAPTARAQDQGTMTVSIRDFFFDPAQITVAPGTTVTWVNEGSAPHTVTADDGSFDSETLQPGDAFSFTFQDPGTVAYHCEIHDFMMGSVTVSGGNEGASMMQGSDTSMQGNGGAASQGSGGASMQQPSAQASAGGGHRLPATGGPSVILPVALLLLVSGALGLVVLRRGSSASYFVSPSVQDLMSAFAIRGTAVRGKLMWAGISLVGVCGLIHLITAPEQFEEATYLGQLFVANAAGSLVAAIGIYQGRRWGWGLGVLVAGGAFVGYVISRTIGLPGMPVEEWLEPLGILSLLVEGLFVGLFLAVSTRRGKSPSS